MLVCASWFARLPSGYVRKAQRWGTTFEDLRCETPAKVFPADRLQCGVAIL